MAKTRKEHTVHVRENHPAWSAFDDDDWNGATFGNWLGTVKGKSVVLWPPADFGEPRLRGFVASLWSAGVDRIVNGAAGAVGADTWTFEEARRWVLEREATATDQVAEDLQALLTGVAEDYRERLRDALDTLKRFADATEAAMGTEPDMPTYESTMDEFENTLDESRQLLKNEAEEGV